MKGYSYEFEKEGTASARAEGVDVSYKDIVEACGRIRGKTIAWAVDFLERAARGEIPILFKRHNKKLGHRKELRGQKGRYPKKAAAILLKVLKSAFANARTKGLGEDLIIAHVAANKKSTYPRLAAKGRRVRSDYEISRVEIVLKEKVKKG